ncbi:MAG: EFR1 family ferrodoxin, partial [Anaerolineaceae bacterium]|nr:EFR1 family ferrodoxin [Anaerolineaceae bacterium]
IPIVRLLQQEEIIVQAEMAGLIFPNFCLTIPVPVHFFLKKADLKAVEYLFAICTRGGTQSDAFNYINEIVKPQGKRLNAQLNITMPWNHPLGKENVIERNEPEKVIALDEKMREKVDLFSEVLRNEADYTIADTEADYNIPAWINWLFGALLSHSMNYQLHEHSYQNLIRFYADDTCNGCSICEKVCLSRRITMEKNKPIWQTESKCYACFACINFCPQKAIQIENRFLVDSHTPENPRYHHESVTYQDIAKQSQEMSEGKV